MAISVEEAHLARQFGMQTLYGFAAPAESFFEVEFSAAKQDLGRCCWSHARAMPTGATTKPAPRARVAPSPNFRPRMKMSIDCIGRRRSAAVVVTLLRDLAVTVSHGRWC